MTERLPEGVSFWSPPALIATWFGSGLLPKIPGTWGSLAAVPVAWLIHDHLGAAGVAAAAVVAFAAGLWACRELAARGLGGDPGVIVIDEVAGQLLTLSIVAPDLLFYVTGFALFRFFDILKPWPVDWAQQRFQGPLGVMLDDVLAAVYAGAGLWFIQWYSAVGHVS